MRLPSRIHQVIAGDPSLRSLDSRLKLDSSKKRAKRSIDRMSEETGALRRATVDLITNEECKKKLKGQFKVQSVHLCAFTPGFYTASFMGRLPIEWDHVALNIPTLRFSS